MSDDMERPEAMADFFDARAAGYDNHMRGYIFTETTFVQFYQAVAAPIAETDQPIRILDLGCGTGLEIETILRRAPNALITGVGVSSKMPSKRVVRLGPLAQVRAKLRRRYRARRGLPPVGRYETATQACPMGIRAEPQRVVSGNRRAVVDTRPVVEQAAPPRP